MDRVDFNAFDAACLSEAVRAVENRSAVAVPVANDGQVTFVVSHEEKAEPESFGRFIYCGRLWGCPHVWSSCDPPNYGAAILLDADGSVNNISGCGNHPAPTAAEIERAQALVLGATRVRARNVTMSHSQAARFALQLAWVLDGAYPETKPGGS